MTQPTLPRSGLKSQINLNKKLSLAEKIHRNEDVS
ncbi:hypothetical protein MB2181_01100 [Methylophilales bacterium HTCC2181]|jgi:hypothetical protein|uniref:Uncharacterized protein n=1 Tax=Methylophilales bacterium HTCC2181 TaxID=383631 RepID=A0P517_9PROT|nr:hypothetical protein MB2181_01100 [Methylophilales bacterium HTCC2181]